MISVILAGLMRAQDTGAPADKEASPSQKPTYRVSPGVAQGNLLRKVNPHYPREAKENHVQGDVILQVTIDREGNVGNLRVVSGTPVLADAALDAVRQWKYRPYKLNGEPVAVVTTIEIQFHL
jgi:protein TonB